MDAQAEWIERVLGFRIEETQAGSAGESSPVKGIAAWTQARAEAVRALTEVESAIRAMQDPDGDEAIIELRSIRANLTVAPATLQQVAELENYLQNDAVIDDAEIPNGFGITVSLRAPLLAALASLKAELTETAGA
jgi:hypothetical protein